MAAAGGKRKRGFSGAAAGSFCGTSADETLSNVAERDLDSAGAGDGDDDAGDSAAAWAAPGGGGGGAFFVFFAAAGVGVGAGAGLAEYLRGTGGSNPTRGPPCWAM